MDRGALRAVSVRSLGQTQLNTSRHKVGAPCWCHGPSVTLRPASRDQMEDLKVGLFQVV